ncbi:glycosyltransferase family 2 protein [Pedobacter changchengzhani]|uniref:Glycosyltransferase family 2 protein n=1 Tax=Pedobacter changchengzhani TaxID=2529274 RepID=A0A4R5MIA9_9SPHI|nr:glycosyltransferase family 2 protein [Pedobacter changchengzhani]TDG35292.1 glycosyltransferase family 2 protein [Pedobacter changchengzhani]
MDVSIIIPTYNRIWCLPKAIESCFPTNCKVEIIVIDDGSNDGTWEWLQNQKEITKIKTQNWGKCWAVNDGFKIAKGKYIKFLDSDDLINNQATDEQFILAEKENADVVVSGYKLIDEAGRIIKEQPWIKSDDFVAQQLGECDSSHYSSYLFRKEFINEIPHRPDFGFRDDRLFVLEVALKKPRVSFHDGYGLLHRIHNNKRLQFTPNKIIQNYQHYQLYRKIFEILSSSSELSKRRIDAGIKVLWPLAHWVAINHLQEADEIVKWIYKLNPDFHIPNKGILGVFYKKLGFRTTEKILNFRRLFTKPKSH